MLYAILFAGAAVAALIWNQRQLGVVLRTLLEHQPPDIPAEAPDLVEYDLRIASLERDIKDLFLAVSDGIDHVDRNEKRVRGIVLGAKRRFEASEYFDPGVDAEADTLPKYDEGARPEERVPPVPDDVESRENREAWAVVPGRVN